MLPKRTDNDKLLTILTPERKARFLLKIRDKCYKLKGLYRDYLGQIWDIDDVLNELKHLPHIPNKRKRLID